MTGMFAPPPPPWVDYWHRLPRGRLLFEPEAEEFVRRLSQAVPLDASMRVLDYGCGYGGVAVRLATWVARIACWDAAPSMRDAAAATLANVPHASIWHGEGPFDLIVVNSVVQYMDRAELRQRLRQWRDCLAPRGRIVLSDLMPPGHAHWRDVVSLFWFSLRRGYLLTALRNTLAERRRYARAAAAAPIFHVDPGWLEAEASACQLQLTWLPHNLTHFRARRTAVLSLP